MNPGQGPSVAVWEGHAWAYEMRQSNGKPLGNGEQGRTVATWEVRNHLLRGASGE